MPKTETSRIFYISWIELDHSIFSLYFMDGTGTVNKKSKILIYYMDQLGKLNKLFFKYFMDRSKNVQKIQKSFYSLTKIEISRIF